MTPPLAWSPWHMTHFSAKTFAPSCGVPFPGGRLEPSGRIAMSHCLTSASEILRPRFGDSASATPVPSTRRRAAIDLRVDMLDLPFVVDAPGGDAVVVLVGEGERRGDRVLGLAALRDELGAQRLRGAGLVPGAAQDRGRLAVPLPRHDEAGERLRRDRALQRRLTPTLAAVG